ncbi:MAG: integration host factor subunit beta [Candidatus Marinimicrobia bacterium]|nr:integration host factor subunit beta [Candidatus Neomarinimicrobiota bacterium]
MRKQKAITFTKKDVTQRVAEKLDVPVSRMKEPVDAVFEVLREIMSQNHSLMRVEIRNFGVFEVKPTKAKPRARNPRTNEEVYVPPRRKSHFKPGRLLREVLREPLENL